MKLFVRNILKSEYDFDRIIIKPLKKILISFVAEARKCTKKNESWQIGHGGCDPTCKNPFIACLAIVDGCFCKSGFVRSEGECISVDECRKRN